MQQNITSAELWYELGVKQQENEREQKAILALKNALNLDENHLASWLALAISYTNDNDRTGTYDAIREWVLRNESYGGVVNPFRERLGGGVKEGDSRNMSERFQELVQCLIEMARAAEGEVDADVQIALAVVLNTIDVRFVLHSIHWTRLLMRHTGLHQIS